jgi:hypothetical protein
LPSIFLRKIIPFDCNNESNGKFIQYIRNDIRVAYKKLALQWHLDKNKNDSEFVIETLPYYNKPCMAGSNILLDLFFQNDGGIVFNIWARIVCGVPYSAYFIFS